MSQPSIWPKSIIAGLDHEASRPRSMRTHPIIDNLLLVTTLFWSSEFESSLM
ncbi:uncharacterized protein RSE6_00413 [Rhynchosporium secalis]|uniref:Uncharacterized protein n=1 Tax=Rhynchosporium secalis TaxID=38038 RepID=A0A1E1LV77_RHYSE|nr:uncharacterized protein RSE6_00413 [Rhynchosporium secalis]